MSISTGFLIEEQPNISLHSLFYSSFNFLDVRVDENLS